LSFIPNTDRDREEMLKRIGVSSFEELLSEIPEQFRLKEGLDLPPPLSELEAREELKRISETNLDIESRVSFLGGGAYDHYIPAVVDHIISRPEFYTAYTPYQAEVSQGTLQTIYEYQSLVCHLTAMEAANASMYDGASAVAEAAHMAKGITEREKIVASEAIHPHYLKVLDTYSRGLGLPPSRVPTKHGRTDLEALSEYVTEETAAVLLQHPNFLGCLEDVDEVARIAHAKDALLVVSADPISLGLLKPPGDYSADICVGEGQPLGIPMSLGGPFLGLFATRRDFIRQMPGRLIGKTMDADGNPGFVMTLQTREQHIRREKATSNICTNEGLCALAACVYLTIMGKKGLREVAELCLQKSHYLAQEIEKLNGFELPYKTPFFKEFVVESPIPPKRIISTLIGKGFFAGVHLGRFRDEWKNQLLIAVTEKRTKQEMDRFVQELSKLS
jgi:glycine dehydrogenase subunit 1